jgi:hypothetical protein
MNDAVRHDFEELLDRHRLPYFTCQRVLQCLEQDSAPAQESGAGVTGESVETKDAGAGHGGLLAVTLALAKAKARAKKMPAKAKKAAAAPGFRMKTCAGCGKTMGVRAFGAGSNTCRKCSTGAGTNGSDAGNGATGHGQRIVLNITDKEHKAITGGEDVGYLKKNVLEKLTRTKRKVACLRLGGRIRHTWTLDWLMGELAAAEG